MIRIDGDFIYLATKRLTMVFEVKRYYFDNVEYNQTHVHRYIVQRYFGPSEEMPKIEVSYPPMPPAGSCRDYNTDLVISSYYGDGNNYEPGTIVLNHEDSYTSRFLFKEARIVKNPELKGPHARNVDEALEIVEVDETSGLELRHYYSPCEDSDMIVSKKEMVNVGEHPQHLKRLLSLEVPFQSRSLKVYTYDGAWLWERYRHEVTLHSGVFVNQSLSGVSSHKHNPFFMVEDLDAKRLYSFNLIYSGNHKGVVEVCPIEHGKAMIGMNDFAMDVLLKPRDSFMTPEAIVTMGTKDEVIASNHKFVLDHIVNPRFAYKDRPILFNSWEGSTFLIDESNLLEMASICKEVGIELFVIDDGWFKGRNWDTSSLGDWVTDPDKFPNGIAPLSEKIHALGLQFGMWFEPEMISRNSDLFRAHPEYALVGKNRFPLERRHQLMLDMTNPEVIDYLERSLSKVIEEAKLDYVKWDYNRFIIDMYPSSCPSGEFFHRYIMGTYDLLERLTKRFPNLLIEGCSSGGGRYDLGLTYYMPQHWGSDNSNTYSRVRISSGSFMGYPVSMFGAHVARDTNGRDRVSSLEDRFNLNAFGAFGYEFDIRKYTKEQLETIKGQIAFYKRYRHLIQYGNFRMIADNFDDERYYSFEVIDDKREEALLFVSEVSIDSPMRRWRFVDLDEKAPYIVMVRHQDNANDVETRVYSGKALMEEGIDLGKLSDDKDSDIYYAGIYSRLISIKKL